MFILLKRSPALKVLCKTTQQANGKLFQCL